MTSFKIYGFIGIPDMKYYYVFLFFVYIVSVLENTALRTPKYNAVFNLAFADLFGSSAVVPKVFDIFQFDHPYILYNDCFIFMFFCYIISNNLIALAYDRLIAISFPLHYQVKVTHRFMFSLIAFSWLFASSVVVIVVVPLTTLSYCKSVVINSYFCDYSCSENVLTLFTGHSVSVLMLWLPLLFIISCYSYIGYALSKVAAVKERVKAFKTCMSHLSLVAIYFLPVMFTFALNEYIDASTRLINMCLTAVFPPMLNPIIYVLQTQEIRLFVKKLLKIKKQPRNTVKKAILK
uniref:G-protein coupled receptors family 1 profile domain-containing protein n=1 Tax=Monopterus albus TaxID=43700 RepID=A0A3Q3IKX7_MONAL